MGAKFNNFHPLEKVSTEFMQYKQLESKNYSSSEAKG